LNNRITYRQVIDRLEENSLDYAVLSLQNDVSIIISQRGGRVLGPFLGQGGESIFWMNSSFASPDSFEDFLNSGNWNLGGERIWIAPELQYAVADRGNFFDSYVLSPQVDPGQYVLDEAKQQQWRLRQEMTMDVYVPTRRQKELHLDRLIKRVEDPLRNLSHHQDLIDGVVFAGYEQLITLSEVEHDDLMSQTWNLVQLNPGGVLLIATLPSVEYTDYYEPVDESIQTIHTSHVRLEITGDRLYKIGYKSPHVLGRVAYFNRLQDNQSCLIVRNFFNNPSAPYPDEPYHLPGCRGDSIHIYNDDGGFGGFGELECQGQAIGADTGKSTTTDQMVLWLYVGAPDKVKRITSHLIGAEL
jgi:hypothetical protein